MRKASGGVEVCGNPRSTCRKNKKTKEKKKINRKQKTSASYANGKRRRKGLREYVKLEALRSGGTRAA
jgi:hypothetical protein